jgi:precorrin-3B methylase
MQSAGGFKFIFPSYLPGGMSTSMAVDAVPASGSGDNAIGGAEEVMIFSGTSDSPTIAIHEQQPPLLQAYADIALDENAVETDVAEERVFCVAEDVANDVTNPSLKCVYITNDQAFAFLFQWKVDTPIAALISDAQRQEALKVITSMIEAPAFW